MLKLLLKQQSLSFLDTLKRYLGKFLILCCMVYTNSEITWVCNAEKHLPHI